MHSYPALAAFNELGVAQDETAFQSANGIQIGRSGRSDYKRCEVSVDGVIYSIGYIVDSQHSQV